MTFLELSRKYIKVWNSLAPASGERQNAASGRRSRYGKTISHRLDRSVTVSFFDHRTAIKRQVLRAELKSNTRVT
jgi:hypothetical protein